MTLLDEWHFLISALRLHIAEEYPISQKPASSKKPLSVPPAPVVKKQVTPGEKRQPEKVPPSAPPLNAPPLPQPVELTIPKGVMEPVMQALCRPFTKSQETSLHDCVAALEKLGVPTLPCPEDKGISQPARQQLLFVSFFAPGTTEEQFVQKVASAVSEKLVLSTLYAMPALQASAECLTFCATKALKGVIMAYSNNEKAKLSFWLAQFGDELQASRHDLLPLIGNFTLFGTPFYELNLQRSTIDDVAYKRSLWNALQKMV